VTAICAVGGGTLAQPANRAAQKKVAMILSLKSPDLRRVFSDIDEEWGVCMFFSFLYSLGHRAIQCTAEI
jgi:hypothetical protein